MLKSILFLISFIFFLNSNAQDRFISRKFNETSEKKIKCYSTKKINSKPPIIDGILDEDIWNISEWQGDFVQFEPNEGEKPSVETKFRIIYDDNNLYVAIKSYDTNPEKIERRMTRRDSWEGDKVGIHIDSYFDKRTAFVFFVNAVGVKNDGIFTNDGDNFDDSWDPIWYAKTNIDVDGWSAEFKIPFSQLRFGNNFHQKWGVQVEREFYRNSEKSLWKKISKDESGWVSLFGELDGISDINPKKQVEISPFLTAKYDNYEAEVGNPFADGRDYGFNGGLDGKIGITNDFILDFTINPDFGQVEADPSELNLSAFESYFQEKRPFFIEGKNITDYNITPGGSPWSQDNLFYSRRIGRTPHYSPELSDGEYINEPENTRILGAVKLTGKTKDGWSVGIIESITNKEKAEIDLNGEMRKETVEPFTNFFIGRLQKDINKGNTIIGAMFTTTNRKIDDSQLNFLNDNAITAGFDFKQYFKDKKYYISTSLIASKIEGSTEAILNQQESSRRYYQRPDANYVSIDSTATFLIGQGGNFAAGKQANSGLRYALNITWRSPGLELNDVGYLRQANTVFQYTWLGYSFPKPFSIFRNLQINMNQWAGWDFGGINTFDGGNFNTWMKFNNLWSFGTGIGGEYKQISNTALRGGPSIILPGNWNTYAYLTTNNTKKLFFTIGTSLSKGLENYFTGISYWADITYKPINNLSVVLSPSLSDEESDLQYIAEDEFNGEKRYLFGSISQKTFSLTLRLEYSITPDLSIQYYGAPFITAGKYADYKMITNPKADEYKNRMYVYDDSQITYSEEDNLLLIDESLDGVSDYSFEKPDFNFKQFRSNLVIRWEYIPGSVIYAVWSQGKTLYDEYGDFNYKSDFDNLFSSTSENIFMLKIAYKFRS